MGICGVPGDVINSALVDGLREAIKTDLTDLLMETAEKEIENVVKEICNRFEVKLYEHTDMFDAKRHIKLDLLITHKDEKCGN